MKLALLLAAVVAVLASAAPALASPLDGLWQTPDDNGTVRLYDCGAGVCGKIVNSDRIKTNPAVADEKNRDASLRSRLLKDLVIVNGVTGGPKQWKNGSIYNPDDGGTYHGEIRMVDPDTLKLTGCIIYPFCKSETWRRLK